MNRRVVVTGMSGADHRQRSRQSCMDQPAPGSSSLYARFDDARIEDPKPRLSIGAAVRLAGVPLSGSFRR